MASEFTGSPSLSAWLTSSLYSITSADVTDPPSVGSRNNLAAWLSGTKIALLTLCSLGLVFNGFVLVVLIYGKRRRRLNCNVFIINQSLADFMSCLSIIVNALTAAFISEYKNLPGASVICIIFQASLNTANIRKFCAQRTLTLRRIIYDNLLTSVREYVFSPLGKVAGRAIYFTDVFSLFYFFFIFFNGRLSSQRS